MVTVNFRGCEIRRKSWAGAGWDYAMCCDDHCAFRRGGGARVV